MKKLVELFCDVDDFYIGFAPQWQEQHIEEGTRKRRRENRMSLSEITTIIIGFYMLNQRDFKNYYTGFIARFYVQNFPTLLSYTFFRSDAIGVSLLVCLLYAHQR